MPDPNPYKYYIELVENFLPTLLEDYKDDVELMRKVDAINFILEIFKSQNPNLELGGLSASITSSPVHLLTAESIIL